MGGWWEDGADGTNKTALPTKPEEWKLGRVWICVCLYVIGTGNCYKVSNSHFDLLYVKIYIRNSLF